MEFKIKPAECTATLTVDDLRAILRAIGPCSEKDWTPKHGKQSWQAASDLYDRAGEALDAMGVDRD